MTHIQSSANIVKVEELRNTVTVDQSAPTEVTVSINGSPNRTNATTFLHGTGAPWTIIIDVGT